MPKRVESPSSIICYKQCHRKYYYLYIKKLPTIDNIHQIRGNITHKILQDFFKINPKSITDNYEFELKAILFDLFKQNWFKKEERLRNLDLEQEQLKFYYEETGIMLENWFYGFLEKLNRQLEKNNLENSFKLLTPKTELEFISFKHNVHGFIDAIHEMEDEITIVDYKTSKQPKITEEYKLQLAIYALLYAEKYNIPPTKVGINFLKFNEQYIDVDQQLLDLAKRECEIMHINTQSSDIKDYPKSESPLCNYSTGQCDFYEICKNEE